MRRVRRAIPLALLALAAAGPAPAGEASPFDPGWGVARLWNDGKAEVAVYDAEQKIYGAARRFEAVVLTVKEPVDLAKAIKTDRPADGRTVADALKTNFVMEIPTPNYDYRFLACVQSRAADLASLVRQTVSSQEWCGAVYKEFTTRDGRPRYLWNSYWEAEGVGERAAELGGGAVSEEQLFTLLRSLRFADGLRFDLKVHPPQFSNCVPEAGAEPTAFAVEKEDSGGKPAWLVAGHRGDYRIEFVFASEAPNPLLRFAASDGRAMRLKSIERRAYWELPKE